VILYDAGLGDVIDIPAHYPSRVTVTGWRGTIIGRTGSLRDFTMLEWAAPGWQGTTLLSDNTLVAEADPQVKAAMQAKADAETEAAFAALLELEN
jgi:hypothetical protein